MSHTVTVLTTTEGAELVAAFLSDLGAEGVSIKDSRDLQDLLDNKLQFYWDYIDDALLEKSDVVSVVGYYAAPLCEQDMRQLQNQLVFAREQMPVDMGLLQISCCESTHDDDWYDNWKAYYRPIAVGNITVVPAWQQAEGRYVVKINPCMAFGTGEHESTQMCLDLLQTLAVSGKQIVDVGCGSGILGIAAIKMGAKHAYFADIDPDAMRNMEENAQLNSVTEYTARTAGLLDGCDVCADIMLANITADILIMLSKSAAEYIRPNGHLIISGIIAEREDEVVSHFVQRGFSVVDKRQRKDWRAYLLQRS